MSRIMRMRWMLPLATGLVALALSAPSVAAQENELRVLVPRLERLESDLAEMQRRLARGGGAAVAPSGQVLPGAAGPDSGAIVRLDDRVNLMERQLAELTGRIEEVGHRLEQMRIRLDKLVADVDFRLGQLEGGGKPPAEATGGLRERNEDRQQPRPPLVPPPPRGAGTAQQQTAAVVPPKAGPILPEGSPMDRYNFAIGLLARQDYPTAEAAFREFIAAHPGDRLTGNAQYWLGETYYVRNDMTQAAQAFLEGVKKYPDGAKAADTMLKLGMSLTAINQKTEACGVFSEMKNRFPNPSRDTQLGLAAARERASCK